MAYFNYLINILYIKKSKLIDYSFEELYRKNYNIVKICNKSNNNLKLKLNKIFTNFFKNLLNNHLILKNIYSVNSVLFYPLNICKINFIKRCKNINNKIINFRFNFIYSLKNKITNDLIIKIYYEFISNINSLNIE